MRLLPLAKYANGVVRSAACAWVGAVTLGLLHTATIAGFADSLSERVGRLRRASS